MRSLIRRPWIALGAILVVCSLSAGGCKDNTEAETDPIGVTPSFAAESPAVADNYISLESTGVSGGRITIDVVVTDVSVPISGIALKLRFPSDIAFLEDCLDADLFSSGSCIISALLPQQQNEVFISRSPDTPESVVPSSGGQTIARLVFVVFGTGIGAGDPNEHNLKFLAQNIGGGDASALLDGNGDPIPVSWFSGTLMGM